MFCYSTRETIQFKSSTIKIEIDNHQATESQSELTAVFDNHEEEQWKTQRTFTSNLQDTYPLVKFNYFST